MDYLYINSSLEESEIFFLSVTLEVLKPASTKYSQVGIEE